jgi:hypothetical protein
MVGKRGAPGTEDGENADPGTGMLGVGGDDERGLSRNFEQQVVHHRLLLIRDIADCARHV